MGEDDFRTPSQAFSERCYLGGPDTFVMNNLNLFLTSPILSLSYSSLLAPNVHYSTICNSKDMESESESHTVMPHSLAPHGLYSPWNSPGQNTGVGSRSLLQGVFLTQRSNPGLPHCWQILYQLSHQRNPRILEWVAYPFSQRIFPTQEMNRVSCTTGRSFTS